VTPGECPTDKETRRTTGDFDDDGRDDVACQLWQEDGHGSYERVVRIVTASGKWGDLEDAGGQGSFDAIDIEPDGRAELLIGGTSASAAVDQVLVWVDNSLQVVHVEGKSTDADPFLLREDALGHDAWTWLDDV
jgi:hypothetical protein